MNIIFGITLIRKLDNVPFQNPNMLYITAIYIPIANPFKKYIMQNTIGATIVVDTTKNSKIVYKLDLRPFCNIEIFSKFSFLEISNVVLTLSTSSVLLEELKKLYEIIPAASPNNIQKINTFILFLFSLNIFNM
ncbi:MAG: hypothetical protein K0R72_590 [Clostridia bacterium]|nr:hypothetical protein [Clostridia bacterium]